MEPVNLIDYERLAGEKLPAMAFEYYAGGACDEITLRENRTAYDRIRLKQRVLANVSKRDMTCTVLGQKISFPVMTAPMAFQRMAHPSGEIGITKACSEEGVINILSTLSTTAVEDVVKSSSTPVWFQLYVYRDREATKELVKRVISAGCKALVVTVDAPLLGKREKDVRNRFVLPEGLDVKNMSASLKGGNKHEEGSELAGYFASELDPSLRWKDVEWFKSIAGDLPVVLKGITSGEDAELAVEHGADGIVVSNHGGRQLDTCRATIDILPEVRIAAEGKAEIYIDGGIRRGTDIVKAIALGAKTVVLGRPMLWGLAVDGENGARKVLQILKKELDLAMALCGCRNVKEISRSLIV
jgi:4-hydroxymandelate oxidase